MMYLGVYKSGRAAAIPTNGPLATQAAVAAVRLLGRMVRMVDVQA